MLPTKRKTHEVSAGRSAFARAKERFTAKREQERRSIVRIGFIIDATGSRSATWEQALTIQGRMFRAVAKLRSLSLRLVHFGGGSVTDHGWMDNPRAIAAKMARLRCEPGYTQIVPALETFIHDAADSRANALILIGDAFEEWDAEANIAALALNGAGIRVFSFVEGNDEMAHHIFRRLADRTGGKFARFGDDLPLADLCEGVALLAAGGEEAVKRLGNRQVRRLLLTGPSRN